MCKTLQLDINIIQHKLYAKLHEQNNLFSIAITTHFGVF